MQLRGAQGRHSGHTWLGLGRRQRRLPPLAAAAALGWLLLQRPPSPVKLARRELVQELGSTQPDRRRIDELLDQLLQSAEPFEERLLGGGPWQVVYSRGPLLWQGWTRPGTLAAGRRRGGNRASQDFRPGEGRRVVNRGEVLGEAVFVTAEGSYAPQDDSAQLPKLIKASIESGALHCWGRRLPLPIRGSGLVSLAYLDAELRIFRSPSGAVTVQVREDRLPQLLGRG